VLEITILPKGLSIPLLGEAMTNVTKLGQSMTTSIGDIGTLTLVDTKDMIATRVTSLNPRWFFDFPFQATSNKTIVVNTNILTSSGGGGGGNKYTLSQVETHFSSVLGGIRPEIDTIIRRVLDSRIRHSQTLHSNELQTLLDLGLSPVRGMLLYGAPGCGKTALAREISRILTDRPPKIVSAPELLDRWVGGSERLVRELFSDAEAELVAVGNDVTKSGLHVIIIDEVDAVFRKRSASSGSGEVARASAVNQILAKLDGVNSLDNILVIGTTNRRELLDEALLRPGRLEVQLELPLPDQEGRREILQIYFGPLRRRGRLTHPLCCAIDGKFSLDDSCDRRQVRSSNRWSRFAAMSASWLGTTSQLTIRDLASDRWTGKFSGADLEGLVRCAGSLALARARKEGTGVDSLLISLDDVRRALDEVKQ
jgi:SpoVK/Ycf46/Vps4 family AAA+-type ATPase